MLWKFMANYRVIKYMNAWITNEDKYPKSGPKARHRHVDVEPEFDERPDMIWGWTQTLNCQSKLSVIKNKKDTEGK